MAGRLAGKVCVITGTGGSMGRAAALTFAREGAGVGRRPHGRGRPGVLPHRFGLALSEGQPGRGREHGLPERISQLQEPPGDIPHDEQGGHHRDDASARDGGQRARDPRQLDLTGADRLLLSNAALALLVQATETGPVLAVVDDLPWLDRASALVLGVVARRLPSSRAGFLAVSRSGEDGFFDRGGLPVHEVLPLDDAAAAELVGDRFPALAPRVRQRLLADAQGKPAGVAGAAGGAGRHREHADPAIGRAGAAWDR